MHNDMKQACFKNEIHRFVRANAGYVRSIAARMAPYPSMADDIAQDVFLIACSKWDTFDPSRDMKQWLAGICRNLCRKAWREESRAGRLQRDGLAETVEQLAFESDEHYIALRREALERCLDKLPQRSRTLVDLRYYLEIKSDTIADYVPTSAEAVRMALVRIRRILRDCILQMDDGLCA